MEKTKTQILFDNFFWRSPNYSDLLLDKISLHFDDFFTDYLNNDFVDFKKAKASTIENYSLFLISIMPTNLPTFS